MSMHVDHTKCQEVTLVVADEDDFRDALANVMGEYQNVDIWVRPARGGDE